MSQPSPTWGTSPNYAPVEFPKAGRNLQGQSCSAKDPEHQGLLESAGFTFPAFIPRIEGNFDHVGRAVQEYPRAMHGPKGASALAKNPDHQAELEQGHWRVDPYPAEMVIPQQAAYTAPDGGLTDFLASRAEAISKLQVQLADEQKAHKKTKGTLEQAVSDKEVLQAQLDKTANRNKAEMQRALDELQTQHTELKMAHEQLLAVVGK